jgi:murein DD-endopeptidase MepM/ murein hydrolase activator NlpD
MRRQLAGLAFIIFSALACMRSQPEVIVITATFEPRSLPLTGDASEEGGSIQALSPIPDVPLSIPTADPTRPISESTGREYIVQPGDTLYGIALAHGASVETLLTANNLPDPNQLSVGQTIILPGPPNRQTSDFKIIPDSRLVRGPGAGGFDVFEFVGQQPGYIQTVTDTVKEEILTGAEIVSRVSLEFSIDSRLLLALLEYRGKWLSNPNPSDEVKQYPLRIEEYAGVDRSGLYKQLALAADQLNRGYYGWRYRGLTTIEVEDGLRLMYAPGLNAGTVGVQHMLSLDSAYADWDQAVSPRGLYATYVSYFGDPFAGSVEPLVPPVINQPAMDLPFASGETWFFTGGPHGGWGSGSAWSAVDFAPPDERAAGSSACYVSEYWVTASAPGIIARSDEGSVILDLDGDGDETTGWTILYLHISSEGRIGAGTPVQTGDQIGHPSCEGGFSNATHMHIARRYNGEWIPVTCDVCAPEQIIPPFVMGEWTLYGYSNQEYQGYMLNGSERRNAEQGRLSPDNRVSW